MQQKIPIPDLPRPSPSPAGWESIEAYRHWVRGGRCASAILLDLTKLTEDELIELNRRSVASTCAWNV